MSRNSALRAGVIFIALLALAGCSSGTTVAPASTKTATVHPTAHATSQATTLANICFIDPSGPRVPALYISGARLSAGPETAPKMSGTPVISKDGLQYVDIKVGSGLAAKMNSHITADYTGWLASTCKKFDSSYDSHGGQPSEPFTIMLNPDMVIRGWVEGISGMKTGGVRRIYIPATLGYGSQAVGPIPANSDLIFDVQLISIS